MKKEPTIDEFKEMLEAMWHDRVEFTRPPSDDNPYIDIRHDADEGIFSATLVGNPSIMTGVGGFLNMWNKDVPVKYNDKPLPVVDYDHFYEYCKTLYDESKKD